MLFNEEDKILINGALASSFGPFDDDEDEDEDDNWPDEDDETY